MSRRNNKKKYKDVVGGRKDKQNKKKSKPPRKTYSLYKSDLKKGKPKKRQHDDEIQEHVEKKPKLLPPVIQAATSSESEEETEDPMQQLRETLGVSTRKSAVDSEGSSDDSEAEELNSNNIENIEQNSDDESLTEDDLEEEHENAEDKNSASVSESFEAQEEEELDAETQKEDDNVEDSNDPFVKHLFYDLHDSLLNSMQSVSPNITSSVANWPKLGMLHVQIPKCEEIIIKNDNKFSISETKIYASAGKAPVRQSVHATPSELSIKSQIWGNLKRSNKVLFQKNEQLFTNLQNELFSVVNSYQDLYYPYRSFDNAEEIRFVYCLHAVNHILKTRTKVLHHNARLNKKDEVPEDFRDQGLVRPKILFLVPFKDSAYKITRLIINILLAEDKGNVMNKIRFEEDYTGNEIVMPKKNPKPEDFEQIFTGNTSDDFKMGITITKKSIKLYADFYSADIIVASPLGLRTIIGAEGEPERNFDFLASIELLILDQTELFLMQNWDHLLHIFDHLHLQPKDSHGTDFSRVRTWSLNGWSKYYRQTLIFSSLILPEINAIFNKRCQNYAGKVKVVNPITDCSITQVYVQIPHVFQKFNASSAAQAIDARFDFFVNKILNIQRDPLMKQTVVFVASYFDFVRLRNYFKKEDISFSQICEYTKDGKVAKSRDMFFHGDAHFLLYTERYHFFNRIRLKGIRHLVFYQPPTFPHFYYEMCNLMQETNMNKKVGSMSNMTVTVLYSKYDIHQLAAIVGSERANKMVQSDRNVQMMVTGGE